MTLKLVYSARSGKKTDGTAVRPQDCALVVVHVQNHDVDPTYKDYSGRPRHSALSSQMTQSLAMSIFKDVVPAFQRRGVGVFLIGREVAALDRSGRDPAAERFYQYAPQTGDTVIIHNGLTPFADGMLARHLRTAGKKHLYFAGMGADPYAPLGLTAREAVVQGFHAVLLSDKVHTRYGRVDAALTHLAKEGVDHAPTQTILNALPVLVPSRPRPHLRLV